jgi:protoheme IX farnesyltransferase
MALPGRVIDWHQLFHVILATLFIGAGANAFNQILEKDIDAKMKRTQNRPLPSGRLDKRRAVIFAGTTGLFGIFYLFFLVNTLSGILGLVTFSIYVFCYTPMKSWTKLNTFVGAIPGATPVVMGWAAARGSVGVEALTLFLILYFWQLPHFVAIAWTYKEDYLSGGLKMITLSDLEGARSGRQLVFYAVPLLVAATGPYYLKMAGFSYLAAAGALGLAFLSAGTWLAFTKLKKAKAFIPISIAYLLLLSIAMAADKQY